MLNFNKSLKLFINGVEYAFDKKISFELHPTNFSSITFNDCIPLSKKDFPNNLEISNVEREFSFAEIFQDGKLIFFGILNDTGRLSLFPNRIKTKSIIITDFRRWLSLTKPINKLWFKTNPSQMVNDIVSYLDEPRIQVGDLDFTKDSDINSYNGVGKTAYQLLKNVITKQSNSMLYFTIKDDKILINYKSNASFDKVISPIILDINNIDFLQKYKINDIEYENETSNYANYLRYDSENLISNKIYLAKNLSMNVEKITLENPIVKIENDFQYTYILQKDGIKKPVVILNSKENNQGKYYDVLYTQNSSTIQINQQSLDNKLFLGYYIKSRASYESLNEEEISIVSKISKTKGVIYQYEKYNDITNPSDLIKMLKTDINIKSIPQNILTITCGEPIWDILDTVSVVLNNNLSGNYIVHSCQGESTISGDSKIQDYTYVLKQTKDTDNYLNKFDNQSFRDQPVYDENLVYKTVETLTESIDFTFTQKSNIFTLTEKDVDNLQLKLQGNLIPNAEEFLYHLLEIK